MKPRIILRSLQGRMHWVFSRGEVVEVLGPVAEFTLAEVCNGLRDSGACA